MDIFLLILFYSFLSGITVFLGGLSAYFFEKNFKEGFIKQELIHFFIAFGTGVMLSAIAFVLIPQGLEKSSLVLAIFLFLFGGIIFYLLDSFIQKRSKNVSQILAMLLDFVPESIALGALFAYDYKIGIVLALFIALQNFPEAFNSFIELRGANYKVKSILVLFFFLSFVGVVFSAIGYFLLSTSPNITSMLMLFSAGGILYLIFQDIAPTLKYKNNRFLAIGVNIGFLVGIIGERLV